MQHQQQLAYGVWDGIVYDNRQASSPSVPPSLDLELFSQFNYGNPTSVFMGDRGFLVFEPDAPLMWALWKHFEKVAVESCGRCSPCRVGARFLAQALGKALKKNSSPNWEQIAQVAQLMIQTSLCGVGKTGPVALWEALSHFAPEVKAGQGVKVDAGFYSVSTSPCIEACPGLVDIPNYIDHVKDGEEDMAVSTVLRHYPLVGSCGRVCVRSCESACRRAQVDEAVSIRNLKRYVADRTIAAGRVKLAPASLTKDRRVAVIGAGPAGLSCAYHLLERGYPVDIYEAKDKSGGMIRYGIPVYRLPKETLAQEADMVTALGGQILYKQKLGRDFKINDLFSRGYKAVFISCGCPQGSYLGMEGEDTSLADYENGIDFLERVYKGVEAGSPPSLAGDVVVVGGGNVAMDCCRAAVRVSSGQVHLIYRRTEADAPADHEEIAAAKAEGVQFHFLCGQDALVLEDGKIVGLRVVDMERTEPDASGRRGVKPIQGSEHVLPCSHVIAAIGQNTDPDMLSSDEGIDRDRKGCVIINSAYQTSRPGVFAGGDCTSGPRASGPTTMIMGMGQAYFAARAIDRYLSEGESFDCRWRISEWIAKGKLFSVSEPEPYQPKIPRTPTSELEAAQRRSNFEEVELTMSPRQAAVESSRCMRCYRVLSVATASAIPGAEA